MNLQSILSIEAIMHILTFNCGSSSQCARLYEVNGSSEPRVVANFHATNVDTPASSEPQLAWQVGRDEGVHKAPRITHRKAALKILKTLQEFKLKPDAIGHRYVHGGERFTQTTRIDDATLAGLHACFPLAPIHNPNAFSVIEVCRELLPGAVQFAVFDTAFHAGLPAESRAYALPRELAKKHGYYKVGFHGLSCQYVSGKAAELLGKPRDQVKLIICHLGTGGSSVTAFAGGHSVDTSMGFSPLAGLVMSTRCGDLDPEIVIDLGRKGYPPDEVERILNRQSGLIGLSGLSSNLAEVIAQTEGGDEDCRVAFEVYATRVRHYLGAYSWRLNGADAIVFTDGIGTGSWQLREKVCSNVENLGVKLDQKANRAADPQGVTWVHATGSKVKILVLPTDEERVILEEVQMQIA
jgi:acetate kinase